MSTWSIPRYDRHQFSGRRTRAVSATSGIAFSDYGRMHLQRRERTQERRLPTPQWAMRDDWLRELLVVYLEERFYVRPNETATLTERLARARAAADYYAPLKREYLRSWIHDYKVLSSLGMSWLSDEEAITTFISLKHIGGQLPLNADLARQYLAKKRLKDLEVQIQNVDTDLVLTQRGHAQVIVAIVYLYYRLGWDSVAIAEQLQLKSPHIRQVLARLHETWRESLSQKHEIAGEKEPAGNLLGAEASTGSTSPEPFAAIFAGADVDV